MTVCIHFWRIAPPEGEWSLGVCRFCGEERQFRNSGAAFYQTTDYDALSRRQAMHAAVLRSEYGTLGPQNIEEGYRE